MRTEINIKDIEQDLNKDFVEYIEAENLHLHGLDQQEVSFIKGLVSI